MIVPQELARSVLSLAQNFHIAPPTLSQFAAISAFDSVAELDNHVARYRRNREILLQHLPKAGIDHCAFPEGAFYLYADISRLSADSVEFCHTLLNETGVACTPGLDFDPIKGATTIRLSFAGSTEGIEEACQRIINWVKRPRGIHRR
jgi:aspartate/methionine/tyrosine aminotransferase